MNRRNTHLGAEEASLYPQLEASRALERGRLPAADCGADVHGDHLCHRHSN